MDEVDLEFTEGALHAIAKQAKEKKVGARALRAIIEEFMLDIMYEIPKDDNIGKVTITEDYVEKKGDRSLKCVELRHFRTGSKRIKCRKTEIKDLMPEGIRSFSFPYCMI